MVNDNTIKLEIGDFLGFCDLNGVESIQTEQVQRLEELVGICNERHNNGEEFVTDAIYDRLMEILRKVNPDSELCKYIWEDSVDEPDDSDRLFLNHPMYSIQTVKSFNCDEIKAYVDRLPDDSNFDAHISVKLNGHGIRVKYAKGDFFNARSRARASAGRDITPQLKACLEEQGVDHLVDLEGIDLCEIRGEWVLPFENVEQARQYNPQIKSAFSGVSSMGRASASEDEWKLLRFVAYEVICDDLSFSTKDEEYNFLSDLGFEVPMNWVISDCHKSTLIEDLKDIVRDCEMDTQTYEYYTDGLVFTINDTDYFRSLGDDGSHYKFGNMALKVGKWKQDMYCGFVQTILWMKGKTKVTPVAIVADAEDTIEYKEMTEYPYIWNKNVIANYEELGVITACGNKVRRVPLYEPANILALDAFPGNQLYFRYGGEAGVVPCFEDGTSLIDGRVQQILSEDDEVYMDLTEYY